MRHQVAALLAHGLAGWLVLWWPFAGAIRARYPRRDRNPTRRRRRPAGRWSRSIRRKWAATALLVPLAWLAEVPLAEAGLRGPTEWGSTLVLLLGVLGGGALVALRLRLPRQRARLRRVMQPFVDLVPRPGERTRFVGLAVTAGVTEELLYRGFGITYLHRLAPGWSSELVVLVVATAFGLAHLYQGWKNVLLTGLLGVLFGVVTVDTRSVLPAIVVHTLIDLRILLLTPLLTEPLAPTSTKRG